MHTLRWRLSVSLDPIAMEAYSERYFLPQAVMPPIKLNTHWAPKSAVLFSFAVLSLTSSGKNYCMGRTIFMSPKTCLIPYVTKINCPTLYYGQTVFRFQIGTCGLHRVVGSSGPKPSHHASPWKLWWGEHQVGLQICQTDIYSPHIHRVAIKQIPPFHGFALFGSGKQMISNAGHAALSRSAHLLFFMVWMYLQPLFATKRVPAFLLFQQFISDNWFWLLYWLVQHVSKQMKMRYQIDFLSVKLFPAVTTAAAEYADQSL